MTNELKIKKYVTGVFQQNTWLVSDGETNLLIDCGDGITAILQEEGITPDALLLTHTHMDHVWDIATFQHELPEVPIYMHKDDLELLRVLPKQGEMIGMPMELEAASDPTNFVTDEQTLNFGQITIKIIHVQGHTEGGVCYIVNSLHCFSGDMLFAGSVGRTDLPGGDSQKMHKSLGRIKRLDSEMPVYSGHGPITSIGQEIATNQFLQGI